MVGITVKPVYKNESFIAANKLILQFYMTLVKYAYQKLPLLI
jgi:hypothetical protein